MNNDQIIAAVNKKNQLLAAAFAQASPHLIEAMRDVKPEMIRVLALEITGETYITIFQQGDEPAQLRLWSERPGLCSNGRADWGMNIGIAESSTTLEEARRVIERLRAEKVEDGSTYQTIGEVYKVL